jgi:hypothetical protein
VAIQPGENEAAPADEALATAAGASPAKMATRIALAYRREMSYRRRTAFRAWLAFIVTFVLLRLLTYGIHYQFLPFRNITTSSGLHIHHFVWGIGLLILVGFIGLMVEHPRWHPWLAIAFGIGAALVLDEFALWLHLSDVYWTDQGQISVDIVIVVAALLGLYYAANCFWIALVRELRSAARMLVRGEQLVEREERRLFHRHRREDK